LNFGIPDIKLHNIDGTETLKVNGELVNKKDIDIWTIPDKFSDKGKLIIQVFDIFNNLLTNTTLYIDEPKIDQPYPVTVVTDKFGEIIEKQSNDIYAIGASPSEITNNDEMPRILPLHLGPKIIFIGPTVDKISDWPNERLPNWKPVWAIVFNKSEQGVIYFCGDFSLENYPKQKLLNLSDLKSAMEWQQIVLPRSGKYISPKLQVLQKLWSAYERVANND